MDVRESFERLLSEFAAASGIAVERDDQDGAAFEIGEVIVNLQLLNESGMLVCWSTLGFLGNDANADLRIAFLMKINDAPEETGGYSIALDRSDADRVLVHDIRPLVVFDSADRLAAWVEALVDLVVSTRAKVDAECPYVDDDDLDPVFEEVT